MLAPRHPTAVHDLELKLILSHCWLCSLDSVYVLPTPVPAGPADLGSFRMQAGRNRTAWSSSV